MPEAGQTIQEVVAQDPAERAALETSTAGALSSIFADGDEELVKHAGQPSKEADEPAVAPKTSEEAPAATEIETTEKPAEQAAVDPAAKPTVASHPTVPAAYNRSLKAYQWTDEEIANGMKADPVGFLKMAERVHANRNEETKRWVEIGRKQQAQPAAAKAPEAKPKFDAKALRDKYGDEPFIAAMEHQAAQLDEAHAFIDESRKRQAEAEVASLNQNIDRYFSSADLTAYHDVYGKDSKALTEKQVGERMKVMETANLLISGATQMGRSMTLDEALTMAHDSVSAPIKEKVAVKKVETAVRARQQAISMRPGAKTTTMAPDTRKDLEKTVKSKLDAAFK